MKRKIIKIDESKCNGCGLCVEACAEGAIQIIDGKAKLVSEIYCDGLGACIGECPQGAITIEEREAKPFDEKAVERHLEQLGKKSAPKHSQPQAIPRAPLVPDLPCGCPGSSAKSIIRETKSNSTSPVYESISSELGNWPVQIKLVPIQAPYLQGAKLLISADCAPFAYADFHRRFIQNRIVLIGCPKLDDAMFYQEKLTELFKHNDIQEIEVAYMEVPCCFGLVRLVHSAIEASGKKIPLKLTKISIQGGILETEHLNSYEREARL